MLAAAAAAIATQNGCTLHEGFPVACIIGGQDWGPTLHAMGLLVWVGIVTSPLLLVGLPVHLGLWVAGRGARR
jgi:hypothetical protein